MYIRKPPKTNVMDNPIFSPVSKENSQDQLTSLEFKEKGKKRKHLEEKEMRILKRKKGR